MDFELSEEERSVRDTLRRVAEKELAPRAAEIDENETFVSENLEALARLQVMGMNLPEAWGGPGLSAIALSLAVEEIAAACAATASTVTAHFLATDAILLGGDDALRRRYLPDAAAGRRLGAFALTEPGAGSNPAAIATRAVPDGDGYRLQGVKHFITNGGVADFVVVFAVSDPDAGREGIDAFVVDAGTPGLVPAPPERTLGLRGSHIFELSFDCRVPAANRIGSPGSGFRTAMAVLDRGRMEVASMALGIARAALDAAVRWCGERQVSGRAVGRFQGIRWMVADMATGLEAARWLTYRAAALRDSGRPFAAESAMAKLFASEMAGRVTDLALQIHGGYGYTRALPLERLVRDARILRIFEGTSEVQRNIVARYVLDDPHTAPGGEPAPPR